MDVKSPGDAGRDFNISLEQPARLPIYNEGAHIEDM
jgi:hypothetical protein